MKTTEKNKLIAEFMQETNKIRLENNLLDYEWDWQRLMEVVEKIESLETPIINNLLLEGKFETYEVHIENKHVKIYAHGEVTKEVVDLKATTKIETVYNACVEFILWYNKQNPA